MLGSTLCPELTEQGFRVLRQGRSEGAEVRFDPLDATTMAASLAAHRPDVVVNLIAESNVDLCQVDMRRAYLANVRTVETIATVLANGPAAAHLIHISTDQVYAGPGPHTEVAAAPGNAYSLSKYGGELAAAAVGATIMRTNFVGRSRTDRRTSFSDWLVGALRRRDRFTAFVDVYFGPLHMRTLSRCIAEAVRQRHRGIFNVGCRDGASKAEFAQMLAGRLNADSAMMTLGSVHDVALSAPRPSDMRMDVRAFERTFAVELPTIDHEIGLVARDYPEA